MNTISLFLSALPLSELELDLNFYFGAGVGISLAIVGGSTPDFD